MAIPSSFWSESWRVLAYSAAAARAFVALEKSEFALLDLAGADRVLALTRSRVRRRPPRRRSARSWPRDRAARPRRCRLAIVLAAFRLGYEIGWARVRRVRSRCRAAPAGRRPRRSPTSTSRSRASRRASSASIRLTVALLPSRTLADFVRLQERFEADEGGLAARVEARLTPIHRHLFLLGVTVGNDAAKVQGSSGKRAARRSTRSAAMRRSPGIAPAAWQPLAIDHRREPPTVVLDRHRARGRRACWQRSLPRRSPCERPRRAPRSSGQAWGRKRATILHSARVNT